MKVLTIDRGSFPPQPDSWTQAVRDEYEEADIVIYLFSPYAHYIMKGPDDLVVKDARERWGQEGENRMVILEGSRDEDLCESESEKLRSPRKGI